MPKSKEVEEWFKASAHPLKGMMLKVRSVILAADRRMEECIKWKTPTFTYEGNLASFNPNTKKHVSLMFHTGAKIPGTFSALQGGGNTARYMKFETVADITKTKKQLESIVKAWIKYRSGSVSSSKKTKTVNKRKTVKKVKSRKKTSARKSAKSAKRRRAKLIKRKK